MTVWPAYVIEAVCMVVLLWTLVEQIRWYRR